MNPSATIKIFLPLGDPKRVRTAEISNWSGKAIAAPRSDLDRLLNRRELLQPGVYLLLGEDPDSGKQCSGQPIPDSGLSFSSATAGGNPSLN
ncbi:hypothetical protein LER65_10210, partial [Pseudomonas aeruginosa]